MFRNYFKIALRNLLKQKAYSLFNLFGLSLGITCGLLLTLHIKEELSYEKNFPNHERIFRVVTKEWSKSHPPLAGEMAKFFPEIKSLARFSHRGLRVANSEFNTQGESLGLYADSTAVEIFGFKSVLGNPVKALSEPSSILITESMWHKYFGKKNPIGQKLTFDNEEEFWVKAVIEDLPENTHLKFDYLASMSTFVKYLPSEWYNNRGWMFGWTYALFNSPLDVKKADSRMTRFLLSYYQGDMSETEKKEIQEGKHNFIFQPLTDIHLKSNLIQEMGPNSNILYIYIFIAVEILILIIACVNFINLFTTQALKRLKEVGIRKVLGAHKGQLVFQFLGEAFILTFIAGFIAVTLYQVALPFYNSLSGKNIIGWEILEVDNLLILAGIVLFVGLLSGLYPSLFISRFEPATSIKATKSPRSSANLLRKGLVVFQFVVAGFLIISTVLIYQQMNLFRSKELGFDKEQVVIVKLYGKFKEKIILQPEVLKQEILSNPNIIAVAKASNLIGDDLSVESVIPSESAEGKDFPSVKVTRVDENYLRVLDIKLKEGRSFSRDFNDSASFIINEKAAQVLELKNPIGATLTNHTMNLKGKVVGVIKDFHFTSLHNQIDPLVLEYKPWWSGNMLVKIKAGTTPESLRFLEEKIKAIAPNSLFSYSFLDERIAGLYKKEDTMSNVLKVFSFLAIIISCLGLFGLSAHASEVRTKEIGIRKVIGASLLNILKLLSKDFIILVIVGNLIAWPLAWYAVNKWLQEFTYKINIGWEVFFLSGILTLLVALLTIGYHCFKTARANPVKALKYE